MTRPERFAMVVAEEGVDIDFREAETWAVLEQLFHDLPVVAEDEVLAEIEA